jgi:streptogramin lyase
MAKIDIATGFEVAGQFPQDDKTYFKTIAEMQDLGTSNANAYKYYESMIVVCVETNKEYIWREVVGVETGVLVTSFTYPNGIISNGINYSNRVFNFFTFSLIGDLQEVTDIGNHTTNVLEAEGFKFNNLNNTENITTSILGTTGDEPYDIAVDKEFNVYTVNRTSLNISKITPEGVHTIVGTTGSQPTGIVLDSLGNIFVVNTVSNNISKITPLGVSTIFASTGSSPEGMIIDENDNLYVANRGSNNVSKITPLGVSTILGTTGNQPYSLLLDSLGNIYTTNGGANNITKITPLGVSSVFASTGRLPFSMVFDSVGNMFVVNRGDNNVSKVTPGGVSTIFASTGTSPFKIVIDEDDNLFISNNTSNDVTKITPLGVSSSYGNTGLVPSGIAIDAVGDVYTANKNSDNVTKIAKSGTELLTLDEEGYIIKSFDITLKNGKVSFPNSSIEKIINAKDAITLEWINNKLTEFALGGTSISDTVYGAGWNGDTTHSASKNAIFDKIESIIAGVGTGATPINTTFIGGETTWNTGVTITASHQLTLGSGTGIQSLLHRGIDYTWAGSTFTFISGTLPIAAGEVAFYYPNVAVPTTYDADEVAVDASGFSGNLSPTDTDVQTALETMDALVLGGGTPTPNEITNITKYTTFASLPTVTGSETDVYAYVAEDNNLQLRGLYGIRNGAWKFLYHFEDLNIPIKRISKNWIDLSQPVVSGTPTASSEGIINGYQFTNGSTDGIEVSANHYISNFIPVKLGDRLLKQDADRFWFYNYDKTPILVSEGILPYNYSDRIEINNEKVKYIRWTGYIPLKNTEGAIIKQYDTTTNTAMSGWDDFNGGSDNFQRDNVKYTYEDECLIWKNHTNNLFDYKKGYYPNGYDHDTGATNGNASTGFIPCKAGMLYSTNLGGNTNITFWDVNKTYISGLIGWKGFQPPATAKYFSVAVNKEYDFKSLVVTQSKKPNDEKIIKVSSETINYNEATINRSVCLIGDSIGTEDSAYATESAFASLSRYAFNYRYFFNNSVSGIAMGTYFGNINAGAYDMPNVDEYWMQLSTNDFGYNRGLGSLTGTSADDDFYGNMKYIIEEILTLNPNAKIVWFTALPRDTQYTANAAGNKLKAYQEAVIKYAQTRGDEYLDLSEAFDVVNDTIATQSTITGDKLHPTNDTHEIYIMTKVLPFIKYNVN